MKKKLNLMNYSTFYLTFLCPGVTEKDKPGNDISFVYLPIKFFGYFNFFGFYLMLFCVYSLDGTSLQQCDKLQQV